MNLPESLVIQRGVILHSTIFEYIDHGKFFVIIGEDEQNYIGLFFINSNINYFNCKQELFEMQYPLLKRDYSFLDYDSFLCCTEITTLNKQKLSESFSTNKTEYKGVLLQEHLDEVLNRVRNSKLFTDEEKETYFK